LTRLPAARASSHSQQGDIRVEYSAREVAPPALLLQQLLRAHRVFLLHHATTIAALYTRIPRVMFCGFLKSFWDGFIWNWDVLLHGNPAVDIYDGLKLSAGGEIGIGVGEEDWGSGEREVLEGFVSRTEGLVDLIVSRFGDAPGREHNTLSSSPPKSKPMNAAFPDRRGSGNHPGPADGVIFSGTGALTRHSTRTVSSWMEWLYTHGEDTFGIKENPGSKPRRKRKKREPDRPSHISKDPGVPPSIVKTMKQNEANMPLDNSNDIAYPSPTEQLPAVNDPAPGTETYMKYLTFGIYGSSWGIPAGRPPSRRQISTSRTLVESDESKRPPRNVAMTQGIGKHEASSGCFLVGLLDQLEEGPSLQDAGEDTRQTKDPEDGGEQHSLNDRITMRTLHVERVRRKPLGHSQSLQDTGATGDQVYSDRLRTVIYVHKPFIFSFLFQQGTDLLSLPYFYRSLHYQLGPLQRSLLARTSPSTVSQRLWKAAAPASTASPQTWQPICDIVYDPIGLAVHTTIPNVPEPSLAQSEPSMPWTRVEALSVHSQILNTYESTRRHTSEVERTSKTSRGWWVVWMRLPTRQALEQAHPGQCREAFLVRQASDHVTTSASKSITISRFGREVSGSSVSSGWGPGNLAGGIGIDARQYIDTLLSLRR